MEDDGLALPENADSSLDIGGFLTPRRGTAPGIPNYLEETYWWAYLRPRAIWIFEREWLVNLILWGNMKRLTRSVLDELNGESNSSLLQVACVYGDFSNLLASHLAERSSRLSIVDIAPIQLRNVRSKLSHQRNIELYQQDSSALDFDDGRFDGTVLFFLLHEQPEDVRRRTIAEAIRVTRPGGKVVFVDYHGPRRSNPLRYLMRPVLRWLEPFALDLWRTELAAYLPAGVGASQVSTQFYCGGLYQKVVIHC
jgi:ubiquinone/menaquinone biosynthesis C-methylase UbiE